MTSVALTKWNTDRKPGLDEVYLQYNSIMNSGASESLLHENLSSYAMLISAHLQGFCRELHSECIMWLKIKMPKLSYLFEAVTNRQLLRKNNANPDSIREDFRNIGCELDSRHAVGSDERDRFDNFIEQLWKLNAWRNHCAHKNETAPSGNFNMTRVKHWHELCDAFAKELDGMIYKYLLETTDEAPW